MCQFECFCVVFALFENLAKKLNAVTTAPAPVASAAPTSTVGASASVVGAGAAAGAPFDQQVAERGRRDGPV